MTAPIQQWSLCSFGCQSGVRRDAPACGAVGTLGPESYIPSSGPSLCRIALPNTRRGQEETAGLESCSSWTECILGSSVITGVDRAELSKKMCQERSGECEVQMFPLQSAMG